jgi:FAD/FMN-containing dehydrogenase
VGFFGVVTRFHLRLHDLPRAIRSSTYLYPLADVEEVSAWARDLAPVLPPSVEMQLLLVTAPPGASSGPAGKAVAVAATAFSVDDETACNSLAMLESCPAVGRTFYRQVNERTGFAGLREALDQRLPAGHRYLEDALWTNADYAALLPRLAEQMVGAPSAASFVMTVMPPPRPAGVLMPDMAFSMTGTTFALCYGIWSDEAEDDRNRAWHRRLVESVAPMTVGRYVAEADLTAVGAARTAFAPPAWERLHALKRRWDPDDLFPGFPESDSHKEETS